ncbi:MAG: ATP-dependent DNA helicase RecG [Candidatus Omnitrophica bacterium]|nr:ATP-dependent DNA helicase RecG [Candidatus Omnitrophota bacterium]MBU1127645.1 ATP-dependent DNA helicase RecG [Candidatus Omnitrophota bacterium]MBU1783758.1 ATP-dependent DNA helicase RecG [Candidatus Omnitrophota bacterium]
MDSIIRDDIMQEKKNYGDISVRYLKGVGPKRSVIFKKLGIENVQDLFYYLPRRYEDRSFAASIEDLKIGDERAVRGKILKCGVFRARTGTSITCAAVEDATGRLQVVWYNMPFLQKHFAVGKQIFLYGKIEIESRPVMVHPAFDIMDEAHGESLEIGRIVPIYSLTQDLTQRYMRKTIDCAIRDHLGQVRDTLPTYVRARKKLVDFKFAVQNIHFPHSPENLERAYRRLVFEEFFVLQVIMALRRRRHARKGIEHLAKEGLLDEFEKLFNFEFTREQKKCIKEIEKDMASARPMYRLLQGDVGSGKTVVAMYALITAAENGYQSVMMVPTEILARQHYVTISKALMPLGLNIRMLINGLGKKEKDIVGAELAGGEADIVIGTHSVLQEKINYKNLGLIVIDEQHKFGVDQRKTLRQKNAKADTLIMTATPIPRSLALTVYGDMDISFMKDKPHGRKTVSTSWAREEQREEVYNFLREEIRTGRQAFIVCPMVKDKDPSPMASAEGMFKRLKNEAFRDLRLALIHGRMKTEEKDRIMKAFRAGKYDILVATTVVEVGVNIPNATVMLVLHADRYGLTQLHQLRGRIGRGEHASYFILMGDPTTDVSRERIETITKMDDGFLIAERDLDLRGPGEFLGTRQSGLPELRFGNIVRDFKIMEEAREEAFALVTKDPELKDPRHLGIRKSITERFHGKVEL